VEAVLKMWTLSQGSPCNLGLAVAQLSVLIGILIAFGSPYHSRSNGSAAEIRSTQRTRMSNFPSLMALMLTQRCILCYQFATNFGVNESTRSYSIYLGNRQLHR